MVVDILENMQLVEQDMVLVAAAEVALTQRLEMAHRALFGF
jgi:hypothetical protein